MPIKTPTNIPTLKDLRTRVELWRDEILYLTATDKGNLRSQFDKEYTYARIPATFAKMLESWNQVFELQEVQNLKIEKLRDKVIELLREIYQLLREESENNPNQELKKDIQAFLQVIDIVEVKKVINFIHGKEIFRGEERKVRVAADFVKKDELEKKAIELETNFKESQNCFLGFIEEHTSEYVKFAFQVPDRRFNKLNDYVFRINGVYYEVNDFERINHQNALIIADYSKFLNGYQDFYQNGFSGIVENSPVITPREEKCACPAFSNSTNTVTFISSWFPTYEVWRVKSPLTNKLQGFELENGDGTSAGTAFYSFEMEKVGNRGLLSKIREQFQDSIFYLMPTDYNGKALWYPDKTPIVVSDFHYTDNLTKSKKTLREFLVRGIEFNERGGEKKYFDLIDKHRHLQEHISCIFTYNGESILQCKLNELGLPENSLGIRRFANPSGIIYRCQWGLLPFYWREQIKFVFNKSKMAQSAAKLGIDLVKEGVKFLPIIGKAVKKTVDFVEGNSDKKGVDIADTINQWTKDSDTKFDEQKSGSDNRHNERKSKITNTGQGKTTALYPQSMIPKPGGQKASRWARNSNSVIESDTKGSFGRIGRGSKQTGSTGEGTMDRQSEYSKTSSYSASQVRTTVSYTFEPDKAIRETMGTIPNWFDASGIEKNYTLLDFAARRADLPFQVRLCWNNQLFEHYANSLEIKKTGHKVICEKKAINLLNKPGFHKYIPHMIEKDRDGYFSHLISRGIELYKDSPEEIWDKRMGIARSPNYVAAFTTSGLVTSLEEKSNCVTSEDTYVNDDGRSWLACDDRGTYLKKLGSDENLLITKGLIEQRQKHGAPSLNSYICEPCQTFYKDTIKTIADCWRRHYLWDEILCNSDGTGDYMSARHGDKELRDGYFGWKKKNTEYFRLEEKKDSWGDKYETIRWPSGAWAADVFPYASVFNSPENIERSGNWKEEFFGIDILGESASNLFFFANPELRKKARSERKWKFLPKDAGEVGDIELKTRTEPIYMSNEDIMSKGEKVSKERYAEVLHNFVNNIDRSYEMYENVIQHQEYNWITETYEKEVTDEGSKSGVKIGTDTRQVQGSLLKNEVAEYYIIKVPTRTEYYFDFRWRRKTRSAGSSTRIEMHSLGKGSAAEAEYNKLPENKRAKKEPDDPFVGAGNKLPCWKFNGLVNWQSEWITLDPNTEYDASIWVYKDVNKGEKQVPARIFKLPEEKKKEIAQGGAPWQACLRQEGGKWTIQFNQYTEVSFREGNPEEAGGGFVFEDYQDNIATISMEETGNAEGVNLIQEQAQQETTQELSTAEILEAFKMAQQQLQQEYTEEQIRQIEAARAFQAEQAKKAEESKEEEDEKWEQHKKSRFGRKK